MSYTIMSLRSILVSQLLGANIIIWYYNNKNNIIPLLHLCHYQIQDSRIVEMVLSRSKTVELYHYHIQNKEETWCDGSIIWWVGQSLPYPKQGKDLSLGETLRQFNHYQIQDSRIVEMVLSLLVQIENSIILSLLYPKQGINLVRWFYHLVRWFTVGH